MTQPTSQPESDLIAIQSRLAGVRGRDYWRGLEELADSPEFAAMLHREFPERASEWVDGPSRRQFLRLMGASVALAGASGCGFGGNRPEKLVPPVRQPENMVPGHPLFFASALSLGGYATGVLVESHMGRPIKIEGNDLHPASLGATDAFSQAAVLSLYDPDRSQVVQREGQISTLTNFITDLGRALDEQRPRRGSGVRVLTEAVGSPTLASQIRAILAQFPGAKWYQYEPVGRDNARAGARMAFGEDVETIYDFTKADVVLSLDSEVLSCEPAQLRYARQFTDRRRLPSESMNRLYAVESTPTTVGAIADHRLSLRPGLIEPFARAVARELGVGNGGGGLASSLTPHTRWIKAVAEDLKSHGGRGLIVAGDGLPPAVHALVHAMNDALGNVGDGKPISHIEPVLVPSEGYIASIRGLTREMELGEVELLIILGGNPAYTAPADVDFAAALRKVRRSVHLSLYQDETSTLCRWHINAAHELEMWSDARAFDGTASIVQPLIAPLYAGTSPHELLAAVLGRTDASGQDIVRDYWKTERKLGGEDFETAWQTAVHDGVIRDTASKPKAVRLKPDAVPPPSEAGDIASGLEVVFRPDPTVWDGRFANNGWLQELPKPLTKLTWDNAALISPATARSLGLANENVIELSARGRSVQAPVWVDPGHADGCVTIHLGYGRSRAGQIGNGTGFNAYALRFSDSPWTVAGATIKKTTATYQLACTQTHRSVEGRKLVREGTLGEFLHEPGFAQDHHDESPKEDSLYPPHAYEGYAWGMVVNLNACIGCNACVLGCQSENNIPIVGKEEVLRGREMHWLEIDRYYSGEMEDPDVTFQPRLCMHCENAPCEVVCPVMATSHSGEGINEMTYNRCVGTRYCSNNCPYKVRHFNFFEYSRPRGPSLVVLNNPDVTVRSRGVMEKCTYCIQRINGARIQAKEEGRTIRDGEVVTACQAACPTQAIVFGDINDKGSEVSKLKANPLNFAMLAELNTRPRTTYLARVRNPNSALEPEARDVGDRTDA